MLLKRSDRNAVIGNKVLNIAGSANIVLKSYKVIQEVKLLKGGQFMLYSAYFKGVDTKSKQFYRQVANLALRGVYY